MKTRFLLSFAVVLALSASIALRAHAYESIPRDSPLGKHLAAVAARTGAPLELMLGPHAWHPRPVLRDSAERVAHRAAAVARLQARMSTTSTTSGIPPIVFSEPPTLDSLPPLPAGPKLPDSLTAGMNSFVTGDLDGDGLPDFVGVESADSVLDVRRNLGGGAYAAAVKYALATGAYKVVLGDFNGDGREDVAIDNLGDWSSRNYSVLMNLGAGTLGTRFDGNLPSVTLDIFVADLGHKGRDDLVFGSFNQASVFIVRSLPGGGFADAETLAPPGDGDYENTAATVGDLDGDGYPDVVLVFQHNDCYNGECPALAVFYGRADGSFDEAVDYQAFDASRRVGVGDVQVRDADGDHSADVIVSGTYGGPNPPLRYGFIRNAGHRSLEAPSVRDVATTPWMVSAIRLRPGAPEDVLVSDDVTTTLLRNNGDGTLARETLLAHGSLLSVADLNGDGLGDVITADSAGVAVRLADGSGGFLPARVFTGGSFFAIADFTGNHHKDLAMVMPNGDIGVLPGDGVGGFAPVEDFGQLSGGTYTWKAVDLDGDGYADIASVGQYYPIETGELTDSLLVRWGTGSGFTSPTAYDFGAATLGMFQSPTIPMDMQAGDFNGDGRPDLALINGDGESGDPGFVRTVTNLGHRMFSTPSAALGAGEDPYLGVVADFDGDGLDDLVISETTTDDTGQFGVFRGTYDGTLVEVPGPSEWGGYSVEHYAFGITKGDFNADGKTDIAIGCGYVPYRGAAILAVPNITNIVHPTPTLASLISADPTPSGVALIWDLGGSAAQTTIERRTESTGWITLATLSADGSGRVSYDDRSAAPGARVGYRLRIVTGARVTISAETWVTVPLSLTLAIDTPRPNPTAGPLAISFSVPSAGRATLEVMDVTGRRVRHRELEMPAASRQSVSFASDGALSPGLYFVRLTQDRKSVTSRVAVVR
jgi:FG-GAP-like repeat/Secretion system C-terminal sorting domain